MKKKLLSGALAAVLMMFVGISTTGLAAERDARLWSIAVHFEYADGSEYDYVLAEGVPALDVSSILAECGRSHRTGSVVRYHCYAIPE